MSFERLTEQPSHYNDLEKANTADLLTWINREDQRVPLAIQPIIPDIAKLVDSIAERMEKGGRLFYIGAGTSGRLGVVDASECPPTFGVPHGWVVGIMAGGDGAMRKAVEFAEDNSNQAWKDLEEHAIGDNDTVIGIAASGTTPYVIGGLKTARENSILTACITCNPGAPVTEVCDVPLVAATGPEFVTGSTRMKAGTAQKLILNMISTATMIRLGRVVGNRMVDMQLSNHKLVDRGTRMIMDSTQLNYDDANGLLKEAGSVRKAIDLYNERKAN